MRLTTIKTLITAYVPIYNVGLFLVKDIWRVGICQFYKNNHRELIQAAVSPYEIPFDQV